MVAKAKDSNTETTAHKTSSIDTSSHRKLATALKKSSSGHRKMEVSSSGHRRTDRIPMHIPTKPKRFWFFSFIFWWLFVFQLSDSWFRVVENKFYLQIGYFGCCVVLMIVILEFNLIISSCDKVLHIIY